MLAGLMTVAGELLLLAVALGCHSWRGLLGAGAAPLTLFLSYGYECICLHVHMLMVFLFFYVIHIFRTLSSHFSLIYMFGVCVLVWAQVRFVCVRNCRDKRKKEPDSLLIKCLDANWLAESFVGSYWSQSPRHTELMSECIRAFVLRSPVPLSHHCKAKLTEIKVWLLAMNWRFLIRKEEKMD